MRSLAALAVVCAAACAQTLPEHDNRIFTAVPIAKLSAVDLVQAVAQDQAAASERFVGKAVEVSGVVRDLPTDPDADTPFLLSAGDGPRHVRIIPYKDQRTTHNRVRLVNGDRITLRCFCEGVTDHVQLKSCVVPS